MKRCRWIVAALLSCVAPAASAAEPEKEGEIAPALPDPNAQQTDPDPRTKALEDRVDELEAKLRQAEEQATPPIPLVFNGYIDFGFFVPMGNGGAGWRRDVGNMEFPGDANYAWTFLGDILATTINTRGEVADLGDAPGITRFDSVNSNGAPGFLVNEVNLRVGYQLAESAILRASVNFLPRTGSDFALGDLFDLDVAELEYVLTEGTSLFAGKTLPVFGIEYKERKSHERFGITPSLVQRYTAGTQLGLKIRSKLLSDWLILSASVTNGASTTEQFHFFSEVDQNSGKTLNGRVAINFPVGDFIEALAGDSIEIGGSGTWGPQDRATDNEGEMWFAGADLSYNSTDFALKAQLIRGKSPGRAEDRAWELNLRHSGYVELDWQFLPYLGALVRGELRDAVVTLAQERIYRTKSWRFTGGVRVVFNPHVTLKLEYLHNGEYGEIASFDNDVATSSLVLAY